MAILLLFAPLSAHRRSCLPKARGALPPPLLLLWAHRRARVVPAECWALVRTRHLDRALVRLGLRTAKWGHVTTQPTGKEVESNIMDPLMCARSRTAMLAAARPCSLSVTHPLMCTTLQVW